MIIYLVLLLLLFRLILLWWLRPKFVVFMLRLPWDTRLEPAAIKSLRFSFWVDVSGGIGVAVDAALLTGLVLAAFVLALALLPLRDVGDTWPSLNSCGSVLSCLLIFTVSWLNLASTFMVSSRDLALCLPDEAAAAAAFVSILIVFWFRWFAVLLLLFVVAVFVLVVVLALLSDEDDDEEEAVDDVDVVSLAPFSSGVWSMLFGLVLLAAAFVLDDECSCRLEAALVGVIRPFLTRAAACCCDVWLLNRFSRSNLYVG